MATKMSEKKQPDTVSDEGAGLPLSTRQDTVGTILRRARKDQGDRPIPEIAEEIRVRPHQLEALEADDYDKLPGLIYAAGFIRSYAQYLGLDAQELVEQFKRSARTEGLEARLSFPEPLDDPRIPRRSLVAIACTLAIAVYGTWYGISSHDTAGFEDVPAVETRLSGLADASDKADIAAAPKAVTVAKAAPAEKTEKVETPEAQTMTVAEASAVPVKRPVAAEPKAAEPQVAEAVVEAPAPETVAEVVVEPRAEAAPAVEPVIDTSGQITVRARQDAWVRIEGPGAIPLIDTVLRAGEAYDAPAGQGLYMMTGNAGALDILVNGKHIGALGPQGAIRRHVALDDTLLRTASVVQQQ